MKKRNVINLIRYYTEGNDAGFRNEAYEVAESFNTAGDFQLGSYILALLSNKNTFIPQMLNNGSEFFRKVNCESNSLPLPDAITEDLQGIINAIGYNAGINKFLFSGAPGTGKTESTKNLARIMNRELYVVNFDALIDSKMGQTAKNITQLFDEINNLMYPEQVLILFDEIDSLAMDRIDNRDLREMGRATSAILKGLDGLRSDVVIIATTNLKDAFDKALIRRFDKIIDFDRYSQADLIEISEIILDEQLDIFKFAARNIKLFRKIIKSMEAIPYPGDLKNLIRSSIAFSNPNEETDYLRRLFMQVHPEFSGDLKEYQKLGFTVREIEILSKISKSKIARDLSGV